jgi:hypothetical protein
MKNNLQYHPRLYLGNRLLGKNLIWIKHRIRHGKGGYYLLTAPANREDMLDLIPCKYIQSIANRDRLIDVVGIAEDEEDAQELLTIIVNDCLKERQDLNLEEYLKCLQSF